MSVGKVLSVRNILNEFLWSSIGLAGIAVAQVNVTDLRRGHVTAAVEVVYPIARFLDNANLPLVALLAAIIILVIGRPALSGSRVGCRADNRGSGGQCEGCRKWSALVKNMTSSIFPTETLGSDYVKKKMIFWGCNDRNTNR
jgi:hypothetical protein